MPVKPILDVDVLRPGLPPGAGNRSQLKLTVEGMSIADLVQVMQDFAKDFVHDPEVRFIVQRIHGSPAVYLSISPTRAGQE
jgi:hypothetical protein